MTTSKSLTPPAAGGGALVIVFGLITYGGLMWSAVAQANASIAQYQQLHLLELDGERTAARGEPYRHALAVYRTHAKKDFNRAYGTAVVIAVIALGTIVELRRKRILDVPTMIWLIAVAGVVLVVMAALYFQDRSVLEAAEVIPQPR